ncbi:MAG: sensor histidine kinase [Promethearchaeota archaeon]
MEDKRESKVTFKIKLIRFILDSNFSKLLFVIMGLVLALIIILLEYIIRVFILRINGDFISQLFFPPIEYFIERLMILIPLIFFGIFVQLYFNMKKKSELRIRELETRTQDLLDKSLLYGNLLMHDIKNIFQNVKSAVELIFLELQENKDLTKNIELLSIINEQVNRGATLIKNINFLMRFEQKKDILKTLEIMELLKETISYIKEIYTNQVIEITVDAPRDQIFVKANDLIREIFENLLENAIKYNKSKSKKISIEISIIKRNYEGFVKMQFKDNGIGISDENKKIIFQDISKRLQDKSGMGIGLSIIKKLIESYGGSIKVEDRIQGVPSQGSNFILEIPQD